MNAPAFTRPLAHMNRKFDHRDDVKLNRLCAHVARCANIVRRRPKVAAPQCLFEFREGGKQASGRPALPPA